MGSHRACASPGPQPWWSPHGCNWRSVTLGSSHTGTSPRGSSRRESHGHSALPLASCQEHAVGLRHLRSPHAQPSPTPSCSAHCCLGSHPAGTHHLSPSSFAVLALAASTRTHDGPDLRLHAPFRALMNPHLDLLTRVQLWRLRVSAPPDPLLTWLALFLLGIHPEFSMAFDRCCPVPPLLVEGPPIC